MFHTSYLFTRTEGWRDRWVESEAHVEDGTNGLWGWDAGRIYIDFEEAMGIKTMTDKGRYQISADLGETFSNKDKMLIISYCLKMDNQPDCGGGYIKLFPDSLDQKQMNENSTYYLMFGPDFYLHLKRDVEFVYNYHDKYYSWNRHLKMMTDDAYNMYTLIIFPNSTYEVRINNELYRAGPFCEDFDIIDRKMV